MHAQVVQRRRDTLDGMDHLERVCLPIERLQPQVWREDDRQVLEVHQIALPLCVYLYDHTDEPFEQLSLVLRCRIEERLARTRRIFLDATHKHLHRHPSEDTGRWQLAQERLDEVNERTREVSKKLRFFDA